MKKSLKDGGNNLDIFDEGSKDNFSINGENGTIGEKYTNSLGLSDESKKNYDEKVEFINSEGFKEMRDLQKNKFLLKGGERDSEKIKENSHINKLIIKDILLSMLELTYAKFKLKEGGDEYLESIMLECKNNAKKYLEEGLKSSKKVDNKKLRKCAKIARGETFLFSTNKPGCIRLEVQKTKEKDIEILNGQEYYVRRHIDYNADISNMSDILLKLKFFLDFYVADKKIQYLISSSRLFDDEFNKFWMEERQKEGEYDIPNRIKIREERLTSGYGGKLDDLEIEGSIDKFLLKGGENSLTRAWEKYKADGKKIKEGGGYINLEKLEEWNLNKSK